MDTRLLNQRHWVLLVTAVTAVIAMGFIDPIPQDPAYHQFADGRPWLGLANFGDVSSNLPFALVGFMGLYHLLSATSSTVAAEQKPAYIVFFGGVLLVCLGSGYYHLQPDNTRLVWDRLPMTLAFMGLFSAVVGERIHPTIGRRLLWPLVITGLASVAYWHFSEQQGRGDLRPYALVQFLPMLLIPLILWLFPGRYRDVRYFVALVGFYALSKACEHWDEAIYHLLGNVSGHSLKHLAAAIGVLCFLTGLKRRKNCKNVADVPQPG
ncbi:MAG: ceramidase [Porticoccaceae bacterium]|nr:ceramidase [Porticoccaceae bacterium]